jgi:hypothetical protein
VRPIKCVMWFMLSVLLQVSMQKRKKVISDNEASTLMEAVEIKVNDVNRELKLSATGDDACPSAIVFNDCNALLFCRLWQSNDK